MPRRGDQRAITLSDVAQATGLSRFTAGHVLKGTRSFPAATRAKVIAAAQRLGYRPNSSARAIRYGRFQSISLLPDIDAYSTLLPMELLRGIFDRLDAADHHLVMARFPIDTAGTASRRAFNHLLVDGLILNYHGTIPAALDEWIQDSRLPVVHINQFAGTDTVRPDDVGDVRELTRQIIERGHRRIAYVDGYHHAHRSPHRHFSMDLRLEGYRQAMAAAGLEPCALLEPATDAAARLESLVSVNACTAVICYHDLELGQIAVQALVQGMRLPQDLLLAGIGEKPGLSLPVAFLTIDWWTLGATAADMILARVAGAAPQPCRLVAGRVSLPKI